MTQAEKLTLLRGYFAISQHRKPADAIGSAGYVPGIARLGIPALQETDASLGVTNPDDVRPGDTAVALPSGVATAATFDPQVAYRNGAVLGREAAARGFNVVLGGGVNLAREPRGGRDFEYAGEDPLLAGLMVGAAVKGVQDQHVICTVKHFAVNDQESQRTTLNVVTPWPALRESDLLAFEIAIARGHPGAVMCAYNRIGGAYACENPVLLTSILKQDWHFPGFVMSDWGAVHQVGAFTAGLDQESAADLDSQAFFGAPLKAALANGTVTQARVNDAVTRILRAMDQAGLLDKPAKPAESVPADIATARQAEAEAIVLLRNEKNAALPLPHTLKTLLVVGANSDAGVPAGGGSSQVTPVSGYARRIELGNDGMQGYFRVAAFDPPAPLATLKARLPGTRILWADGRYPRQAILLAHRADAVIIFADQWEGESSDVPDLSLPSGQDALIAAVAAANPRTIVVLETGGPVLMPWRNKVPAILEAWYGGSGGADAIADVLLGKINPSGRLPITFPVSETDLPNPVVAGMYQSPGAAVSVDYPEGSDAGYRWYARTGKTPLYPFGFGLSYTHFALINLQVEGGQTLVISFDVKNTGPRPGADTPQAYVTSRAGKPGLRLIGWTRRTLAPGETQRVTITADPRLLADFAPARSMWHLSGGSYRVAVGPDAATPTLTGAANIDDHLLPP
ncbi:MAG TPA: glycoside hydrolase family 3 C-terminal domain-containing protein [Acetobacteraceae bacterium]|nr:glycoside hydrolase family 3 C-terminal domain-containing protein [Acetobacteraceae bacterium]